LNLLKADRFAESKLKVILFAVALGEQFLASFSVPVD